MSGRAGLVQRLRWRAEYLAYRCVEALIGLMPGPAAARMGGWLGAAAWRIFPKRRLTVLRNLRIAFAGEKTPAEIEALAREVFRRSGANLIASLHTATLEPDDLLRALEVEGADRLADVFQSGCGAVAVLAHMGNWEALAQMFPRVLPEGCKGATVYRPLNNPLLNRRVENTRRLAGLELFSKRHSPLAMTAFLKEGGGLGVLSDQRAGLGGELVPFFGRMTSCTPLPSLFARRAGSAVVGVSVTTLIPGRWRVKLHMLDGEPTTAACMRLLETIMRESPADVFWLQDRWRSGRRDPFTVEGKLSDDAADNAFTKRRRVLVWLDAVPATASDLPKGRPDDLAYEFSLPADSARPAWADASTVAHVRGQGAAKNDIAAELARIDAVSPLPLDFVVAFGPVEGLSKACRRNQLRLVVLDRLDA